MAIILFAALFGLILVGVPVAISLGLSSFLVFSLNPIPAPVAMHRFVNGLNSFPLVAIPLFVFVGYLMNAARITDRIFAFARASVGWMRGGLGHVNVGVSVIFSGMSGTAVADVGGLGAIEIKAMRDAGYDRDFAAAITGASSVIGPIIPPSLTLVVFGVLASTSIGQLFLAGVVPGLLMAVSLMVMVWWFARRRGYPRDQAFSVSVLWSSFRRAFLSLLTPVIIIGGIMFGVFTPTEAATAAVAYALFLSIVVYRTVGARDLVEITMDTVETTAVILLIVGAASVFGWILTTERIAVHVTEWVTGITENRILILIGINLILLVLGLFMEPIAAMTIIVPILLPIVAAIGLDPVQFGIIVVLNLMLGLLTPPVGLILHVLSKVGDMPFEHCVRAVLPFFIPLGIVLILVTFIPAVSLWLPTLVYR
ncbi:TRAP transporter large permease [Fodinicurvata sp. EGI_FJ10296]|uniref:TRAP transporter large permease n=1 Tax=Fodinicurvata sp. EGI_FJ10296 TaxID=3231908 RepID=UPI0034555C93